MSTGSQMETNAGPKRCELAHTWKNTREAGLEAGDLKAGRTGKKTGEASGESGSTKGEPDGYDTQYYLKTRKKQKTPI